MQNYYRILELPDFAPAADIKAAYRRLAKRYHPDVNGGDTRLEELFKRVQHAYDVLSDPYKKANHDLAIRDAAQRATYTPPNGGYTYRAPRQEAPVYTSGHYTDDNWRFRRQALKVVIGLIFLFAMFSILLREPSFPDHHPITFTTNEQDKGDGLAELAAKAIKPKTAGYQPPAQAFKLDDTTTTVRAVQGQPAIIWESGREATWKYGSSSVTFHDGKVWEYTNAGDSLYFAYTWYDPEPAPGNRFTIGATRSVVLQVQGYPITVRRLGTPGGEIWIYADCSVCFVSDRVTSYSNNGGSLQVKDFMSL